MSAERAQKPTGNSQPDTDEFADKGDPGGPEVGESDRYNLPGQDQFFQVEPEASYWARCRYQSVVMRNEVARNIGLVPRHPAPGSDKENEELAELRDLYVNAHDPAYFDQYYRPRLSAFLEDARYVNPWPVGTTLNERPGRLPIIRYGAELASLFEAETPGLWHRHVLNFILDDPADEGDSSGPKLREVLSPPRQALIWHALDNAIDSALAADWHYKWLASGLNGVAFRRRPAEAPGGRPILFDFTVRHVDGDVVRKDIMRPAPQPSPGTPRHPANASGHSTYSAAASYVLGCLLPKRYKADFDKLADNIGEARLWGGVHWRTDHTFGQQIGLTVGKLVVRQLNKSGISPMPGKLPLPPTRESLEAQARQYARDCESHNNDFCAAAIEKGNRQGQQAR